MAQLALDLLDDLHPLAYGDAHVSVIDFFAEKCLRERIVPLAVHPNPRIASYYRSLLYSRYVKRCQKSDLVALDALDWAEREGADKLARNGARVVVPPEMEAETVNQVLAWLDYVWSFEYIADKNVAETFVAPLRRVLSHAAESGCATLDDVTLDILKGAVKGTRANNIHAKLRACLDAYHDESGGFDLDVWPVSTLITSESRLNPTLPLRNLRFDGIENAHNKVLVKKYCKYLCDWTDNSISFVSNQLCTLRVVCVEAGQLRLDRFTRKDAISLRDKLRERYDNTASYNLKMVHVTCFFEWLEYEGEIARNPFYKFDKELGAPYEYKETALDGYVVDQIFQVLPEVDIRPMMFFLLVYCTGMRASEALELKKDCLFEAENGWFVDYKSEKMHDKRCCNPIPKNLYDMLLRYRELVADTPKNWMFPNTSGSGCVKALWLARQLQETFDKHCVTTLSGDRYVFRPHDFRHSLAVDALDAGVPFHMLQSALHHKSRRMTVAYSEMLSKRTMRIAEKIVDIHGHEMPIAYRLDQIGDAADPDWLRNQINPQVLCNGICGKPIELGPCDHAFDCLVCPSFRTSEDYIDVHKSQFDELSAYAEWAKGEGLYLEYETAKKRAENLAEIINSLEGRICG